MSSDIFVPRSPAELALIWPSDLDHISASSLKMAVRCPEQWRQRYVLGKRTPPNPGLINGRADHMAIEHSMLQKISSGTDLPTGEVIERYHDSFSDNIEENGGVGELEVRAGNQLVSDLAEKRRTVSEIRNKGATMVREYHNRISPSIQPTAVEREFELQLPTLPVKVVGRIDLLGYNPQLETPPVLIDRKTTQKKKYKPEPEWVVQAEIYQLVEPVPHIWHITSYNPPQIQLEFGVEPKSREIAMLTLDHVAGEIGYFMQRYGPDTPWPARGKLHSWACGYCGYRPNCWAWQEGEPRAN